MNRFVTTGVFCVLMFDLGLGLAGAAGPRLAIPLISATSVTLELRGDAGLKYRFEASTNLVDWSQIGSGVATDGSLRIEHGGPDSTRWMYYRAVQEGGASKPFASVVPTVSTQAVTTALVTPENGGLLWLGSESGVVYSLRFPSNCVDAPTIVTLSELASVNGVPTAAGLLAAVRLEPAGLMLYSPVFLQIDFSGTIDGRRVSSYGFDNDGQRFHLVPDAVIANPGTNRVRIPIQQLRSYGSGIVTLAELDALAATTPPVRRATARAGRHNDLAGCYPEEQEAAEEMQEQLEDRSRSSQQQIQALLGRERQQQLLGVSTEDEANTGLLKVLTLSDEFYRAEIRPRVADASQSCLKSGKLLPWVLGAERQRALLGGSETSDGMKDVTDLMCGGLGRCEQQAIECCRNQGGDTRLLQALLVAGRQRQLLGLGDSCGNGVSVEAAIEECAPEWYGTLSQRVTGDYHTVETNSGWVVTRTQRYEYVLTATVNSVSVTTNTGALFIPAHTVYRFGLSARLVANTRQEMLQESRTTCEGGPAEVIRDVWTQSGETNLNDLRMTVLVMEPGKENAFLSPYLEASATGAEGPNRWNRSVRKSVRSEFSDEGCIVSETLRNSLDPDGARYGIAVGATSKQFTWTVDTIRCSLRQTVPMRFDFTRPFNGISELEIDLKRVK